MQVKIGDEVVHKSGQGIPTVSPEKKKEDPKPQEQEKPKEKK